MLMSFNTTLINAINLHKISSLFRSCDLFLSSCLSQSLGYKRLAEGWLKHSVSLKLPHFPPMSRGSVFKWLLYKKVIFMQLSESEAIQLFVLRPERYIVRTRIQQ